jgi:hypothetical protein
MIRDLGTFPALALQRPIQPDLETRTPVVHRVVVEQPRRRHRPGSSRRETGGCAIAGSSTTTNGSCSASPHCTCGGCPLPAQLQRDLGADEVVGPREHPKEGTTPVVIRPTSVAGSHPQPRLFGAGLPPRAHPHVTRLVVQLKVGCPTPV